MEAETVDELEREFWTRFKSAQPTDAAQIIAESFNAWRGLDPQGRPLRPEVREYRIGSHGPKTVTDHLGNQFESLTALRKYWGISLPLFWARIKAGWSIEEILTDRHDRMCLKRKERSNDR